MSLLYVSMIAMKKTLNNISYSNEVLNNTFNNITIKNGNYVKVNSIKVTIPLNGSEDECVFTSENKQLIHMMIDQGEIEKFMPYMLWEQTIRSIIFKESSIKSIDLDQFVNWNIARISFSIGKYRKCTKKQIEFFRFLRTDQRSEILSGNDQIVFKQYIKASHSCKNNSVPHFLVT